MRITPLRQSTHKPNSPLLFKLHASSRTPFKIELPDQFVETEFKLSWVDICVLDIDSLSAAADLSLNTFFKPRLKLNNEGMGNLEKDIAGSVIGAFTKFEKGDAWMSNWAGFRSRGGNRMKKPNIDMSSDALIIAAMDNRKNGNSRSLVGLVEISVEEPTGQLPPSLSPLFPKSITKLRDSGHQTYLSNLSVRSDCRRLGLGKFLCEVGEWVAKAKWGKEEMYLHVEKDNINAQLLYKSMGYKYSDKALSDEDSLKFNMDKIDYYYRQL